MSTFTKWSFWLNFYKNLRDFPIVFYAFCTETQIFSVAAAPPILTATLEDPTQTYTNMIMII